MTKIQPFENAEALATLHQRCFDRPWTADSFASLLAQDQRVALAARGEDGLDGFIVLQQVADEAEILTLAVAPHKRRAGLAKDLLSAAMDWLLPRHVRYWHLEVAADNQAALALYHGFGFVETGRRTAYYENVDAVLMQRDLSNRL